MSDIFDEKIKIDFKDINESIEKATEAMDALLKVKPFGYDFEVIARSIAESKDGIIAKEFARSIAKLLADNGVTVNMTEHQNVINHTCAISFESLDFTEHDKVFEDKIAELKNEISILKSLIDNYSDAESKLFDENQELKQHIAELDEQRQKWIDTDVEWHQKCEELEKGLQDKPRDVRINLNDRIKVKLTPLGADIFYHQYDEVNKAYDKTIIEPHLPKVDNLGYTTFQLHDFIRLYGEHIGIAKPNVIDPIEIIVVD